jgi:phospholipid/cholesterol/gamma-HCH transport system ATP-binding protein
MKEELQTTETKEEFIINVNHIKKAFGSKVVLKDITLKVKKGENVVILGKSGQGKSVTIKCIVGMMQPDEGTIEVLGQFVPKLDDEGLKELRKRIGFLFQSGALYDSMNVRDNLSFALKRVLDIHDENEIQTKIEDVLNSVGLEEAIEKMPADLSGGMKKRIALARTLIVHPEIILYDEPTTGLDAITSREISELILQMQKKYKTTSIIITHDMKCAEIVADRIVIMNDGKYIAEGSYKDLANSSDSIINSFFK